MFPTLGLAARRVWSGLLLLASLLGPTVSALAQNVRSDPLCPHIVACEYQAPAFTIRVVDQQTGQPLADVHAIASWLVYGFHGRRGILMALEAVSGPDGQLSFPAWGPIRSGVEGLIGGLDPLVSLFRAGYRTKLIHNATPIEQPDTARIHAFHQSRETFELIPLQSSPNEAIMELRRADDAFEGASLSKYDPISFRQAYVRRLRLVRAEVERLPRATPQVEQFLKILDDDIRFFEAGGGP